MKQKKDPKFIKMSSKKKFLVQCQKPECGRKYHRYSSKTFSCRYCYEKIDPYQSVEIIQSCISCGLLAIDNHHWQRCDQKTGLQPDGTQCPLLHNRNKEKDKYRDKEDNQVFVYQALLNNLK